MRKQKRMSFSLCLAVLAILSIAFTGCQKSESAEGSDSGKVTEIRFAHSWGGGDSKAPFFEPLLEEYVQSVSDDVEINIEFAGGDDMKTKIKVDLAADNMPEVFTFWGGSDLAPLVEAGAVANVSDYLSKSSVLKRDMIDEGSWTFYMNGGETWGVPLEAYLSCFICNSELFEQYGLEYPKTYDDMKAVAKVFNANGIVPFSMGSVNGNPAHFLVSEIFCQYPNGLQEIYDYGDKLQFESDNAYAVAELMVDMKENGIFPNDTVANGDWGPAFALYNEGKAAMTYTYPWMMGQLNADMEAKTDIIPMPQMPGMTKDPATFISGSTVFGFVMSQKGWDDPAKQEAMIGLADFLISDETVLAAAKGSALPAKKIDLPEEYVSPLLYRVIQYSADLEKVPSHFSTSPYLDVYTAFTEGLDELLAGVIDPDGYVDKVQSTLDEHK